MSKNEWSDFVVENPETYSQIKKSFMLLEKKLAKFNKGMRKAYGLSQYACTDLDEIIDLFDDALLQFESRQYLEEQKNG